MFVTGKECATGKILTLEIADGRIAQVREGAQEGALGGRDVWLSPGFLDLQLNGYGGHDFNRGDWADASMVTDDFLPIAERLAQAGTPLFCPTICTNSREAMTGALAAIAAAIETEPRLAKAIPGLHVEGPYLASEDGPRGAHPLAHVRPPDWDEFQLFQEKAGGRIRLLTLAPETEGALPFIEKVVASGVVVAIGHSGASPETIRDAVQAGATVSTHLGNGAHSVLPRHPNYIWEQLAHDGLTATIIADGHHLPPAVVKCIARGKGPERLALVSDAVSLGGLPPGLYREGRYEVLPTGKVVLAGTPYLAGAGHLLDTCMANFIRFTGLSVAEASYAASTLPARILGLEHRKGHLRPGYDADLTLFRLPESGPLEIIATV